MKSKTNFAILACVSVMLTSLNSQAAIDVGGASATDVSNWTTNDVAFVQGTADGYALNWENVTTNTAAANIPNNNFDLTFGAAQNYTIGHMFLLDETVDLSTVAGGIQQMTWSADFDASDKANWIPVIAVTDGGVTNFYRSNNTGNTWNGTNAITFVAGAVDNTFWVGLNGDPIGGINESRTADVNPNLQAATGILQFGFIQWDASTGGMIDPALQFTTAIEQFDLTLNDTDPVITEQRDSSSFETQYDAGDIFDGISYLNDWGLPAAPGTDVISSLGAGDDILTITNNDNNGWVQQDNDISPWETGVSTGGSWTVEVRVKMAPDVGNGFVIWAANGSERGILQINTDSVEPFGLGAIDNSDNTDDFHTFRMAFDSESGLYFFWRDGVELNPSGNGPQAGTTNNRFIIGDCCSSYLMTAVEVDYVRYDTTGAFAPGPGTPLEIISISVDTETNMVTLTWSSVPGVLYAIDESVDLTAWDFEVSDSEFSDAETTSATFPGPPPGTSFRYYRVREAD